MHRWSPSLAIILVASAVLTAGAANAQSAFKGPLKILVGFAAGGSSDIAARMLADKLKDTLGQPVVVENRVGPGGRIAAEVKERAARRRHSAADAGCRARARAARVQGAQ